MTRLLFALLALASLTLTGCCCGSGYGACRPNACYGASAAPVYGGGYAPVAAATGCPSCQAF